MAINSYGAAFDDGIRIDAAPGADGSIVIDGGSHVRNYGSAAVNFAGGAPDVTGHFSLTGGASLLIEPATPGQAPSFFVGAAFDSGYAATGYLTVENGSVLEVRNNTVEDGNGFIVGGYANVQVGRGVGGSGDVIVDGAGSKLLATGGASRITIGREGGYGKMAVVDGGFAGTFNLTVGRNSADDGTSTVGRLVVQGAGSEVKTSTAYGFYGSAYAGMTSYNTIGRGDGGRGYLSILDGGTLTVENQDGISDCAYLRFARDKGSYGYALVSSDVPDAPSTLNVTQHGLVDPEKPQYGAHLTIGAAGQGRMVVEEGGTVNVSGHLATLRVSAGRGEAFETRDQSLLEVRNGGEVTIDSGDFTGAVLSVGHGWDTNGRLEISGPGSAVTVRSDQLDQFEVDNVDEAFAQNAFAASAVIGRSGKGELLIEAGGKLTIDGADDYAPNLVIGRNDPTAYLAPSPAGDATVTGAGSSIDIIGTRTSDDISSGILAVGLSELSSGRLSILDGGSVSLGETHTATVIADDAGSRGTILVDGAGSSLSAGAMLAIGADRTGVDIYDVSNGGLGELIISNDGAVTAGRVLIGRHGTLDIDGDLSGDVELHGLFRIGDDVVGTAEVTGDVAFNPGGSIELDIDGFGAGQADLLRFIGDAAINLREGSILIDLDRTVSVSAGDEVVIIESTGTLAAADRVVYDQNRGLEFLLDHRGNQVFLVAQETSPGEPAPIAGSAGDDQLDGTAGVDEMLGFDGDDRITSFGGSDSISAGHGNDTVTAGSGEDVITGGLGDDTLRGEGDIDVIAGASGADEITGGTGNDTLSGGHDDDLLLGQVGDDLILGGSGADELRGGSDNDRLEGGLGDDNLLGQGNDDLLYGDSGADTLTGAAGFDSLYGGAGDDRLLGGNGADRLDGGLGNDFMNGGGQADTFRFDLGYAQDTILGFENDLDTIEISTTLAAGRTAQQIVDDFGTASGPNIVFDFGNGDSLLVANISAADLIDDILIV